MDNLKVLLFFALLGFLQCKQGKTDGANNDSLMEMDKNPLDSKNAYLYKTGDTIRLEESLLELSENPNVTQLDLDVVKGEKSNFIQMVKPGEKITIEERATDK